MEAAAQRDDASAAEEQWIVWRDDDLVSEAEWARAELIALAALPREELMTGRGRMRVFARRITAATRRLAWFVVCEFSRHRRSTA